MDGDHPDLDEIDLLVRDLTENRRVPVTPSPAVSQPPAAAPSEEARTTTTQVVSGQPAEIRPGSRWSNGSSCVPSGSSRGQWRWPDRVS